MTRFDRYVLSQMLVMFGFFALVLVSVYWVNRAVSLFDSLIADGQSAQVFLEFTALTLPNVMRLVLPVAAFVASVYATNRMVSESEFVVMQATGMSGLRLARPVLVFGLIVALMMTALLHYLVPASRAQLVERRAEIAENITARLLTDGTFLFPAAGVTLYIRAISPEGILEDVFMSDARDGATHTIYTARQAFLVRSDSGPQLLMVDGMAQALQDPGQRLAVTTFDTLSYDLLALVGTVGPTRLGLRELSTPALMALDEDGLEAARASPEDARLELHVRFAQPLMVPAAALIGFAALILGAFSRLGFWRQVLGAVTVVILMQLLHTVVTGMVGRDAALALLVYLPPLAGAMAAGGMILFAGRRRGTGLRLPALGQPAGGRSGT